MPMKTEIAPLMIMTKLEQFDYAGATAIAMVMLLFSFLFLIIINIIQTWSRKHGLQKEQVKSMEPSLSKPIERQPVRKRKRSKESKGVKMVLILIAILYLSLLLFVPLIAI